MNEKENREKQAIGNLTKFHKDKMQVFEVNLDNDLEIILNLVKKKDEIIDLMARELCFVFDSQCQECCKECEQDIDIASECIKQYFERKVEEKQCQIKKK